MTDTPLFEPTESVRDQVVAVVRSLMELLSKHEQLAKAAWLAGKLAILEDVQSESESVADTFNELHGIVFGMGGLMDLHLEGKSQDESEELNAELDRLADQLYELTKM